MSFTGKKSRFVIIYERTEAVPDVVAHSSGWFGVRSTLSVARPMWAPEQRLSPAQTLPLFMYSVTM